MPDQPLTLRELARADLRLRAFGQRRFRPRVRAALAGLEEARQRAGAEYPTGRNDLLQVPLVAVLAAAIEASRLDRERRVKVGRRVLAEGRGERPVAA